MTEVASLVGIGLAIAVGSASPGPSFLMVTRTAATDGRKHALQAAVGIGCAAFVFALASLLGLTAVLYTVPIVYVVFKVAGGAYLIYLGIRIWRSAKSGISSSKASAVKRRHGLFWLQGFATQFSNPKAAVMFASVFATFMPASPSWQFGVALVILVFVIEAGWYGFVAVAMSSEAPRNMYLRYKPRIDRVAGCILVGLGARLLFSAK